MTETKELLRKSIVQNSRDLKYFFVVAGSYWNGKQLSVHHAQYRLSTSWATYTNRLSSQSVEYTSRCSGHDFSEKRKRSSFCWRNKTKVSRNVWKWHLWLFMARFRWVITFNTFIWTNDVVIAARYGINVL